MSIRVFGSMACGDTRRARAQMDGLRVRYEFHDVDADPAAQTEAQALADGETKIPVIQFSEAEPVLVEPSTDLLARELERRELVPK